MKKICSLLLSLVMVMSCFTYAVFAERDITSQEELAGVLKDLGLFKGVSDTDFDLDRAPSRVEALVMLIRVLGRENEALSGTWQHPFADVPEWADKYVGFAYENGLTNGQSATEFGTGEANAAMFVTFVLRALGYSDTNGEDFVWSDPFTLATEVGIISGSVNLEQFWRADVVTVAHSALSANLKNSEQTLAEKLIDAGVFTKEQYALYFDDTEEESETNTEPERTELSAEKIYELCSPAVFYIEICDVSGTPISSGSGFFIDDKGTAVTNFHVIDSAYSAYAQLSNSSEKYEIEGYYDYDRTNDWAIIKVKCDGNSYLKIGDSSTVVGAATVYAIGSPLGLQNTITQGIISNPSRTDEASGVTYIQTSAAISSGSSGGALINKYGEVIGITSAAYRAGQNLNLAMPITVIEGYITDELHRFNPLGFTSETTKTTDPIERRQLAFHILKTFISEYGQRENSDGYREYRSTQYGDGVQIDCYIYYNQKTDRVTAKINYVDEALGARVLQTANFRNDDFKTEIGYTFESGETTTYTGKLILSNADFVNANGYQLRFESFSGSNYIVEAHEQLSTSMHTFVLAFISQIFELAMAEHGEFSIADLGYTNIGFDY